MKTYSLAEGYWSWHNFLFRLTSILTYQHRFYTESLFYLPQKLLADTKKTKSTDNHCCQCSCFPSGWPDSNWRPHAPQTRTLTNCATSRAFLFSDCKDTNLLWITNIIGDNFICGQRRYLPQEASFVCVPSMAFNVSWGMYDAVSDAHSQVFAVLSCICYAL